MVHLDTYRRLLIRVHCPDNEQPYEWEYPTTRTDEEVLIHAANVGRNLCQGKTPWHSDAHRVEIAADLTEQEGQARA